MKKLSLNEILNSISHRNWSLPKKSWSYYQEWNKAIFMHWEVDKDEVQNLLPKNLQVDTLNDKAWISLVAFTMEKIRPKALPAFAPISNFHEVNLRTYVTKDNKPGVYFLNIESEKWLSGFLAKKISGLPYEKSEITHDLNKKIYKAHFEKKNFNLNINYEIGKKIENKTELDFFLTERYCLYIDNQNKLYRYEIHHLPWEINEIKAKELTTNYFINNLNLNKKPDIIHYSKGIQVIAWGKELVE